MPTRRLVLVLAAALSASAAPSVFAHGNLVDVELIDRPLDQPLPTYRHRGSVWVAGRPGSRYAVRMSNRSGQRVLVVLSVDGVNAVSGETAATGQTGYVLGPWQTTEITGWRKSLSEAAAFYFTALPDSYAARTDRPDNVGVIGVAVFREREPEPQSWLQRRSDAAAEPRVAQGGEERERAPESRAAPAAAPSTTAKAAGLARDERLGTGHGEREYAPTTQTSFERASERPAELVRLRYDSVENLMASGVLPRPRFLLPATPPNAFPGFVPDPKG
jgi:hypothetical protein